jgi:hypothetical protein
MAFFQTVNECSVSKNGHLTYACGQVLVIRNNYFALGVLGKNTVSIPSKGRNEQTL